MQIYGALSPDGGVNLKALWWKTLRRAVKRVMSSPGDPKPQGAIWLQPPTGKGITGQIPVHGIVLVGV